MKSRWCCLPLKIYITYNLTVKPLILKNKPLKYTEEDFLLKASIDEWLKSLCYRGHSDLSHFIRLN